MDARLEKEVEAVLFASGRFMDTTHIAQLLEKDGKKVRAALEALQKRYATEDSALRVVEDEGAWKLHVKDEYLDLVSKIVSDTEVSGPVLETLAVIAWRSPMLQSDLIAIRGSGAYEHVKELVERGFVAKEPQGRSYQLRITDKFFEYFDIEGREDIRKVFREVEEAHRQKEMEIELSQKRLEKKLADPQEEEGAVDVDEPETSETEATGRELSKKGAKLRKKVAVEDLEKVLEKSQKTRERIAKEMEDMRPKAEESPAEDEEPPEDRTGEDEPEERPDGPNPDDISDDDTLDDAMKKAKRTREKVEKELDDIDD